VKLLATTAVPMSGASIRASAPPRARGWAGTLALCAAAVLCGCSTLPPPPEPPRFGLTDADRYAAQAERAGPAVQPTEDDLRWWQRFDDAEMARWVERALAANPDIHIARERVVQAQALLNGARAQRKPLIGASAAVDATQRRESDQRYVEPSAALTLDWDADLWGGLRQAERSAAATVMQAQDLAQATRLATAGLAARAYIEWREALLDRQLLADALALQHEVLRVVQVRVDVGLAPRFDLDRAQTEAAVIEADAADAATRVRQALAALQVLAGERPQPVVASVGTVDATSLPALVGPQPVARPIDLLRLRPDLRAAERALEAAAADAGVAEAALKPRLRLPGTLALTSAGLGGGVLSLVTVTVAAVLDLTLYDGGQRSAELDAARSLTREATLIYQQTLLQALQQAEAALVAADGTATRMAALQRADAAAGTAVDQARTLYTAGLTGFLDVIDAQRSALDNRRALARARADAARQAVAGFEAMGLIDAGVPG
jgi:NodT family efflux transporter outer membrane factor (OMF) lipoprotein